MLSEGWPTLRSQETRLCQSVFQIWSRVADSIEVTIHVARSALRFQDAVGILGLPLSGVLSFRAPSPKRLGVLPIPSQESPIFARALPADAVGVTDALSARLGKSAAYL